MPTTIIPGQSNPEDGVINQHDLFRIIEDFQNYVTVSSTFTRPIVKTDGINIPFWILKKLIDDSSKKDKDGDGDAYKYVNIHFGVSLPNQKSCTDDFKTDISNHLTAVVNIGKKVNNVMVEKLDFGDDIITLGFKPSEKSLGGLDNCCANPKG